MIKTSEETKATDSIHRGCGGMVLAALDGPFCAKCRAELREEDWIEPAPPGASSDTPAAAVPRIRVTRQRDLPPGAVPVFGASIWRNPYSFRSRHGLARVPAAEGDGPWEYEDRSTAAGNRHDFSHPEGHVPPRTVCHVRYMTREECLDTYRRVLTGELGPALNHHKPLVSVPEVVTALKGRVLACKCPLPAEGKTDWCHAAYLAWLAATHEVAALTCLSSDAARAVAREADRPGTNRASVFGAFAFGGGEASARIVYLSYCDKRFPLDVAEWAFNNGHCADSAAGDVIARL